MAGKLTVASSKTRPSVRLFLLKASHSYLSDIVKGDHKHSKSELETLVHKHGGDFTQAQLSDQSAIVISPDEKS